MGSKDQGQVGAAKPAQGKARQARHCLLKQQLREASGTHKHSLEELSGALQISLLAPHIEMQRLFSRIWAGADWKPSTLFSFSFFLFFSCKAKPKSRDPLLPRGSPFRG